MANSNNISEDDLFGALGISTSSSKNAKNTKRSVSKDRSSVIDGGLSIDALLAEDPISRTVSRTDAHIDAERNKARQMQLEASRDRTRAWREEVARQRSHSSALASASRNISEQEEPKPVTDTPNATEPAKKNEKSASAQILEVFGPKSVNVDYPKRNGSNISSIQANDEPQLDPIDTSAKSANVAADSDIEQAAQNLWGTKVQNNDVVPQQRVSRDIAQLGSDSTKAAASTQANVQARQAPTKEEIAQEIQRPRQQRVSASDANPSVRSTMQREQEKPAKQSQRPSVKANPRPSINPRHSIKQDPDQRQVTNSSPIENPSKQDKRSDGRSLLLMDAESNSQTVYNSASIANQKRSAYDHDFLSDIRQRAPRPSDEKEQVTRGRELSDAEIYEPRYEQPMVHSSIGPLGVALIIIAVLCVLVAVSMLTGLWDMSNITR